jgi:hypothetical protein
MQSTYDEHTDIKLAQMAPAAGLRTLANGAPKAATREMAGLAALIALFFASLVYVASGGPFAVEASPFAEAVISITAPAPTTADTGSR